MACSQCTGGLYYVDGTLIECPFCAGRRRRPMKPLPPLPIPQYVTATRGYLAQDHDRVRSTVDRRRWVHRQVWAYFTKDGVEYRRSFEAPVGQTPDVPDTIQVRKDPYAQRTQDAR